MELQPETSLAPKVDTSPSVYDDATPENKSVLSRAASFIEDNKILSAGVISTAVVAGSIALFSKGRETKFAEEMIEGALKAGTKEGAVGSELEQLTGKSLMADANLTADAAKSAKGINEIAASDQAGSAASKTYESSTAFRAAALPISVVSLAALAGCAQEQTKVRVYQSAEDCTKDGVLTGDMCTAEYTKAQVKHDSTTLRFNSQEACQDQTGVVCSVDKTPDTPPPNDGSVSTAQAAPASTDAAAVPNPAATPGTDATGAPITGADPVIVNPTAEAVPPPPSVYYRPTMAGFMIDTPDDQDPNRATLTGDASPLYSKVNSPGLFTSHGDQISQTIGPATINESFAANASKPDSYGNVFQPSDDAVSRGSYGYYDGYYHGYYHSGGIIIMPGSSGYRAGGGMSFHGGSFGG